MTPDEVINKLSELGICISRPTLLRYEKQGLIPSPKRGGHGRGVGRWTEYPPETISEAYAAWKMIHGNYIYKVLRNPIRLDPETVKLVRNKIYQVSSTSQTPLKEILNDVDDDEKAFIVILMNLWEKLVEEVQDKTPN